MAFFVLVRRREPECLFGELRCVSQRATLNRKARRAVEHPCDAGVRRIARQREMAGACERIVNDLRDPPVDVPPLLTQIPVEDGGEQRMSKANYSVLTFDYVFSQRRIKRVWRDTCPRKERLGRSAESRDEYKRLTSARWERRDPAAHKAVKRLGKREWMSGVEVRVENASQLKSKERISTRPLVDPQQRLTRERPPQPITQELMECTDAERPHEYPLHPVRSQRFIRPRRPRTIDRPAGKQQQHMTRPKSAHRKGERTCRGRIKPLNVVDRDEQRLRLAKQLQRPAHPQSDRTRIDRIAGRFFHEECYLESPSPRRRQFG